MVGNTLFFTADDGVSGRELWKTDGTAGGTVQVKDISPGAGSSLVAVLQAVGSTLYFQADDGVNGSELWKSDGTAAGTVLVADIVSGSGNSNPRELTDVAGTLYFVADDGASGTELWTSDGTAGGTTPVADIRPGSAGSNPSQLTDIAGTLFFAADDGTNGEELWTSDGTAAGTQLVVDFVAGSEGSSPRHLTAFGSQVTYVTVHPPGVRLLDISNGTAGGTAVLTSLPTDNPPTSRPDEFVEAGNVLFFVADDGTHGRELWRTDGTDAGTMLVKDIRPGPDSALPTPSFMAASGNKVFFQADDGSTGKELWVSDGSEAGTFRLTDINPGSGTTNPRDMVAYNGEVFFNTSGGELWRTDGTIAGTVQFDIAPGYLLDRLGIGGDLLYIGASGGPLWASDGTLAGTIRIADPTGLEPVNAQIPEPYFVKSLPTNSAGETFFAADTSSGEHGNELWKTDGTVAGTALVKDIWPGEANGNPLRSSPQLLTMVDDIVYFTALDGIHGRELWRSDGTEAGTYMVKDVVPGDNSSSSFLLNLTAVGDDLFFRNAGGPEGHELWISDGTEAGTQLVKDIWPGSGHGRPTELVAVGDTLYFQAETPDAGNELWMSDGTEAGTVMLADINPGPAGSEDNTFFNRNLTALKDTLYFAADNGLTGGEPWLINLTSNAAPVADAGGPYLVSAGESITVDASASFDPDGDDQLSYFWDIDGDGIFNDVAGEVTVLDWATLTAFGITEENSVLAVSVRVSDGQGGADTAESITLVQGPEPIATVSGPGEAVPFQPRTFTLSASGGDGGPYAYLIDWNGDGEFDEAVAPAAGNVDVTHAFSETGTFDVGVVSSDATNIGPLATHTIVVERLQLQPDETLPGVTNLVFGGTDSLDGVFFFGDASNLTVFTQFEGMALVNRFDNFGASVNGRVIAYGGGFDDVIAAEFLQGVAVEFHGGGGNDILVGGTAGDLLLGDDGHDLLLGGSGFTDGDDVLFGGSGNDVLFGYLGADQLFGEAGEDLLVGDRFTFSNPSQGFLRIHQEWISPKPYATRITNILNGTGLNAPYALIPTVSVLDDGAADTLSGGLGDLDWFFYTFGQDLVTDHEAGELENDASP